MDERQKELLKLIVDEYIKYAHPIGSNALCSILDCSSATIRSEMAKLEDYGYLEKAHISSGRIPSDKGYRYYVDNLMKPKEMTGEDMLKLQTIFHNNELQISDAISLSLEIILDITSYTGIVLGSNAKNNKLKKVEIVPLNDNDVLTIVITDKGHVEHKNINISGVSIVEVKKTVDLINKLLIGTPINDISTKLEFEIKPIIGNYVKQHQAIYNAFYNAFSEFSSSNTPIQFLGRNNILKQPEFNSVERIKTIIDKFDDVNLISDIKEEDNNINIYIGSENVIDDNVTVIKTKYNINGEEGTIAVIGPKRMEYERIVTMLNYIKENVERL